MKRRRQFPGATPYTDRHGKRRWRFRKGGFSAELGSDYGSDEFVLRYEAALKRQRSPGSIGAGRTKPGSFAALVVSWYRSPEFCRLSPSTARTYRGQIEPLRERHGDKPIDRLEPRHVAEILAEKAETPSAANNLRKRLIQLLDHAVFLDWRRDNPARATKPYRVEADGFHTWDEGEIARFFAVHAPDSLAHRAVSIMLYTGAARVDAVALGWQNIRAGRIEYRRQKTRKSNGMLVSIPIHPHLEAVLELCPRDRMTFLETQQGRARSPEGLGNLMRRWADAAGLPECTSHGLRKACARRLAEAGATASQIQAITGHKTLAEVSRYTSAADRSELADAAFSKLVESPNGEQKLANLATRFAKNPNTSLKRKDKK